MDYFAKFKDKFGYKQQPASDKDMLLEFEKHWKYCQHVAILSKSTETFASKTDVPSALQKLVDLLVEEESRQSFTGTGGCMEFLLKHKVLENVLQFAKDNTPIDVYGHVINFFSNLISLLEHHFLFQSLVHKPLLDLLHLVVYNSRLCEKYEDELVELMYAICAKIDEMPALLHVFFHDRHLLTNPERKKKDQVLIQICDEPESKDEPDYEFLLFTYLLRFTSHAGRNGDYARTALLFLLQRQDEDLCHYMLHTGNLPKVLASGLSALFSNIVFSYNPPTLEKPTADSVWDAVIHHLDASKSDLEAMCGLLKFSEDAILVCSEKVACSILDHVDTIFLHKMVHFTILEAHRHENKELAVMTLRIIAHLLSIPKCKEFSFLFSRFFLEDSDRFKDEKSELSSPTFSQNIRGVFMLWICSGDAPLTISTMKLLSTLLHYHHDEAFDFFFPLLSPHNLKQLKAQYGGHPGAIRYKVPPLIQSHRDMAERFIQLLRLNCELLNLPVESFELGFNYHCYLEEASHNIKEFDVSTNQTALIPFYPVMEDSILEEDTEYELNVEEDGKNTLSSNALVRLALKEPFLQLILSQFAQFYSKPSSVNLALTELLGHLLSLSHPVLYMFMYEGDRLTANMANSTKDLLDDQSCLVEASSHSSLYTVLHQLILEHYKYAVSIPGHVPRLVTYRRKVFQSGREERESSDPEQEQSVFSSVIANIGNSIMGNDRQDWEYAPVNSLPNNTGNSFLDQLSQLQTPSLVDMFGQGSTTSPSDIDSENGDLLPFSMPPKAALRYAIPQGDVAINVNAVDPDSNVSFEEVNLLRNAVIMEEFVKELLAYMQLHRTQGLFIESS
jgi:hypothetical protein